MIGPFDSGCANAKCLRISHQRLGGLFLSCSQTKKKSVGTEQELFHDYEIKQRLQQIKQTKTVDQRSQCLV